MAKSSKPNGKPTAMTWVASQKRWTKQYRGVTYSVSCKQLGTEPTKEASRVATNDWWQKKRAEIDKQLGVAKRHPVAVLETYHDAIENHRLYAKWQRKYGNNSDAAAKSEAMIDFLTEALKGDNPPFPLKRFQESPLWEIWNPQTEYEIKVFAAWNERIGQIRREEREENAVPKENTIRAHIDDYLTFRKNKVSHGDNTLGTYDTYRGRLLAFRSWVDPFAPIENLNEALWQKYYTYLTGLCDQKKLAHITAGSTLNAAKEFIKSRYKLRLIELPRNIDDYCISPQLEEIEVFTLDEIRLLLANCHNERERLYLLLMLNCGFYASDIGKLTKTEYQNGHILRKRSKTRKRSDKVPLIDYPLWDETNTLLKKHTSVDPVLVLLNSNGSPLWKEVEKDGKFCRISNIKAALFRIKTRANITKKQKSIRKTSASLLGSHPEYGKFVEYFLGESPTTTAQTHYDKPTPEQFARAVQWLGEQYGLQNPKMDCRDL